MLRTARRWTVAAVLVAGIGSAAPATAVVDPIAYVTMDVFMDSGQQQVPRWTPPRGLGLTLTEPESWACQERILFETREFEVSCAPTTPPPTGQNQTWQCGAPGVIVEVNDYSAGAAVRGTATCTPSSASCEAVATLGTGGLVNGYPYYGRCQQVGARSPMATFRCRVNYAKVKPSTRWKVTCYTTDP